MIKIRTFIGSKINYVNGILRRQIELDRSLKNRQDIKLIYEYYFKPNNPIEYFSNRYLLYPYYSRKKIDTSTVNHITAQYLGELSFFLDVDKTLITCHDIDNFLEKRNLKNPYPLLKYSLLGLKKCRYVIAISNFTRNELINKLNVPNEKVVVIKNGINNIMFKPMSQNDLSIAEQLYPDYKKVLHVGTELGRKDFLTLLKAFYLIKKHLKNVKLIRIGSPSNTQLIKNLGLEKDIVYLENISNERLCEIYNMCDFFAYPSLYEGWGAPGLEAACCGTPVICTDIPIFKEVYQDFPLYFKPRDYKALASLVLDNINNESIKKDMSKRGLNVVKQYSWEKSAEHYLKLVKSLLVNC